MHALISLATDCWGTYTGTLRGSVTDRLSYPGDMIRHAKLRTIDYDMIPRPLVWFENGSGGLDSSRTGWEKERPPTSGEVASNFAKRNSTLVYKPTTASMHRAKEHAWVALQIRETNAGNHIHGKTGRPLGLKASIFAE